MNRLDEESLLYYDKTVSKMIHKKYGMKYMDAVRSFVTSKTHGMLEDVENDLHRFGAPAIFDMWECEKLTGDPRNSIYIRSEF